MKDKIKISYWLVQPGEDLSTAIDIMSTIKTSRVPDVGEVLHINTMVDKDCLFKRFPNLTWEIFSSFVSPDDSQIKGNFVVCNTKRLIKKIYYEGRVSLESYSTGNEGTDVPISYSSEEFEVYIQPFSHTELTETPISKVRNLLSPIFGQFDLLEIILENPEKYKELLELYKKNIETSKESIVKLREILGNSKNWK